MGLSFITSQQAGLPPSLIRPDWAGWAPRFGFAYDLSQGATPLPCAADVGVFNSLGELDYASETRLSAPITEFLFGLDTCRFYGAGACGQSYAPSQLSYPLAYTLGNPEPTAISSPPNLPQRLRLRMEFVARPRNCAQYRSFDQLYRVRRAQTSPPVACRTRASRTCRTNGGATIRSPARISTSGPRMLTRTTTP